MPEEVAQAAQNDPTVRQDILSINRDVPQAIAEEMQVKRASDEVTKTGALTDTATPQAAQNGTLQSAGGGTHIPIAEDKPVMTSTTALRKPDKRPSGGLESLCSMFLRPTSCRLPSPL